MRTIEVHGVRITVDSDTGVLGFFSHQWGIDFEAPWGTCLWQVTLAGGSVLSSEESGAVIDATEAFVEIHRILQKPAARWCDELALSEKFPDALKDQLDVTFNSDSDWDAVQELAQEQIRGYYEECSANSTGCESGSESGPVFIDIDDDELRETI